MAVLVDHSTDSRTIWSGRWGIFVPETHCREGEAGYNVSLERIMEDTQRSQPISPENQRSAEHAVLNSGEMVPDQTDDVPPVLTGQSSLKWIRVLARD